MEEAYQRASYWLKWDLIDWKRKKAFLVYNPIFVEYVMVIVLYKWMLSVLEKPRDRFTSNYTSS